MFCLSSRRRHTRLQGDWSSDVCSSDLFQDTETSSADTRFGSVAQYAGMALGEDLRTEIGRLDVKGRLPAHRSEERRVGKECRYRWPAEHPSKTLQQTGGNQFRQ